MESNQPLPVFVRLKFSDWHLPLFCLLCSAALLFGYDLSCTPERDQGIIKAFLGINFVGFFVILFSFFADGLKPIIQLIVTVLIVLYNIAMAVMLVFFFIGTVDHFNETRETCHMDETVDMYFVWMASTIICNLIYICYKKMRRRHKFDKQEELIVRGSFRTGHPR